MNCRTVVSSSILLLALGTPAFADGKAGEALVDRWLQVVSFDLPTSRGGTSYDPATQTVHVTDLVIGDLTTSVVELHIDDLSVEDPRLAPGDMLAAHAIRASGFSLKLRMDAARWFPEFFHSAKPAGTDAPAPGSQKPAGMPDTARPDAAAPSETPPAGEDAPETAAADSPPPVIDYLADTDVLLLERPVLPLSRPAIAPDADIVSRYFAAARWFATARIDWQEMDKTTVTVTGMPQGEESASYDLIYCSGMHDGRIERCGVEGYANRPKADNGAAPAITIDTTTASGIDVVGMLDAFDPAAYVDGKGDGRRRTLYSHYLVNGIRIEAPDTVATIGGAEAGSVYVRQSDKPLLPLIAGLISNPKSIEDDPVGFVGAFLPLYAQMIGTEFAAVNDIKVEAEGADFGIGSVTVTGLSGDGIEAIAVRDITGSDGKEGGISGELKLVTLNDLRFGQLAPLLALAKGAQTEEKPSPEALRAAIVDGATRLGFFETSGFSLTLPDGTVALDGLAVTSGNYLSNLPRRNDVTFTGFNLPAALVSDADVRGKLVSMGYDALKLSGALTLSWDPDGGDLLLEDLTVKSEDMGLLSADIALGNLPLSIFLDPDQIEARLQEGTLNGGSLTYGNAGLVEKGFEMQARELKQDPETFRKNTASAIPLMLTFLDDKAIQKTFEGPIKAFLADPQSITLTLAPKAPVPFAALESMDDGKPADIFRLLGLSVTANE